MNAQTFLAGLHQSPDYLLQNLDVVNRRGLVVKLTEAGYRRTSFLDERALTAETQGAWFPLDLLLTEAGGIKAGPAHFIFQVGHCGSTLVSKLLAELPGCFPVREPITLLMLALERRELERPVSRLSTATWDKLLLMSRALLSRTYRPGDRAVVKATSACGNLVEPLLWQNPNSRALFMHMDLEVWLATMLRNEVNRENGRAFAQAWLMDLHALTGRKSIVLASLSDAEQFAINWLSNMLCFQRAEQLYPQQIMRLDFEALLQAPTERLTDIGRFFGFDTARAGELAAGPLMKSYAKNPTKPYDSEMRRKELMEIRQGGAAEIRIGLALAEKLCGEIAMLAPLADQLRSKG
jgi:hypothetical protein